MKKLTTSIQLVKKHLPSKARTSVVAYARGIIAASLSKSVGEWKKLLEPKITMRVKNVGDQKKYIDGIKGVKPGRNLIVGAPLYTSPQMYITLTGDELDIPAFMRRGKKIKVKEIKS